MTRWIHHVKLKHLLEDVDHDDAQQVHEMLCEVAKVLRRKRFFSDFDAQPFVESIDPEVFQRYGWTPKSHANQLLDKLYSFADAKKIWIE